MDVVDDHAWVACECSQFAVANLTCVRSDRDDQPGVPPGFANQSHDFSRMLHTSETARAPMEFGGNG